jgi:DNA mismatch endonuclease (patch repair protein)
MDRVDGATRGRMMSAVRAKDTAPEMLVRRELHARGFRYRLHDRKLPGRPDLVLPRHRAAIFVNGCFWHLHECELFRWPETRKDFWREKLTGNRERDNLNRERLAALGWRHAVIWECALRGRTRLSPSNMGDMLEKWMHSGGEDITITGHNHDTRRLPGLD